MKATNRVVVTYKDAYDTERTDEYFNKFASINNGTSLYISHAPFENGVVAIYAKDTWKAVRTLENETNSTK